MITEDYVSFEVAKLLKEKGFNDVPVYTYYLSYGGFYLSPMAVTNKDLYAQGHIAAPTLQMVMKWLREEKDVQIEITIVGTDTWESPTKWMYGFRCQTKDVIHRRHADFSSYEEACEVAIKYCLENLI